MRESAIEGLRGSLTNEALKLAAEEALTQLGAELSTEVVERIPLVGWIFAGFRGAATVRDRLLARKVCFFLAEASSASQQARNEFTDRLHADAAYSNSVTEIVLETLDKVSRARRATLLGKAFAAHISGEIDSWTFNYCAQLLERLTDAGLDSLSGLYDPQHSAQIHWDEGSELAPLGLLTQESWLNVDDETGRPVGVPSQWRFRKCDLGQTVSRTFGFVAADPDQSVARDRSGA